jgi:hypothetical protein
MRCPVFRRSLLLLPATVAALALPVAPALAGESPDGSSSGSATLHVKQGCVSAQRAKATVTGTNIASVTYYVDGKRVKRVTTPSGGRYVFSMSCSRLTYGAHRARAVVTFTAGTSPASKSMRFQITRVRQASARFTG